MTTDSNGTTPLADAYSAGLEAVARIHDDALAAIARLAETWNSPEDQVRVVRLVERPTVIQRAEAAAA